MAANELSLDEIYAPVQKGSKWQIDPEVQAKLDEESATILQQELRDPRLQDPATRAATERTLERRQPGATPQVPDELSLDAIYGGGDSGGSSSPAKPSPAAPAKPAPVAKSGLEKAKETGKQLLREVGTVGDMVLGTPAAAAGTIGEIVLRADLARQMVDHKSAAEAGRAFREEISSKGAPTWFSNIVNRFVPPDEEPQPTHIEKALNWLQGKIDQGGDAAEKATGGYVARDDVSGFVNGAMNALGLKATMKAGAFAEAGVRAGREKKGAPKQALEGATPDPENSPFSPAEAPHTMTPEEFKATERAWKGHIADKGEAATQAAVAERQAKVAEQPINKAEAPVADVTDVEPRMSPQAGKVSYDQIKNLGALSLGFMAGAYLDEDNPIVGGVIGAVVGGGTASGALTYGKRAWDKMRSGDDRVRIDGITEARQFEQAQGARATWQAAMDISEALPKKADRIEVFNAIDEGKIDTLSGAKKEAALRAQKFFADVGEAAVKEDVVSSLRDNYVTHFWDKTDEGTIRSVLDARQLGPNMSAKSPFDEARSYATLKEGKAAGLVPKTEDLADVVSMYGDSVTNTIANKRLMDRLRTAKTEDGALLVRVAGKAPANYVAINHPSLARVRIHPDIAPSLRFMFEQQDAHGVMAGLNMLNTALKRNAVSFSLFHAKALADAMLGAVNNPLSVGKVVGQAAFPRLFGKNAYLEQLRKGGAGDIVDKAQRDGLQFSYEGKESVDSDVGNGFYQTLKRVQQVADSKLGPVAGLPIKSYIRINHAFDNFMWGRLHTAMKLQVYAAKKEALIENTARAKVPLTDEAAGKIAADYANTIFGGLNWQRIAESVNSKFGRDLALSTFSPKGRRGLQLMFFAPDWTMSTSMAFTKAFGKGTGIQGLFGARTAADLYRQQLVRSAFYYLTIGDALNMHYSDHHLWENKDPTYIDLGDGRKMQMSKHFMEPIHWLDRPGQQGLNKLGVIPSEAAAQLTGKEYLSTKGAPPMKNRLTHALNRAVPIGANQFSSSPEAGVAGALGVPIYGKTVEQKRAEAKQRRQDAFDKRMKQYKQQSGLDK